MKDQRLPTLDEWLLLHGDDPDTTEGPHLISVDELRAAGALDVPAAWRKSLAPESRYTLPGFADEEAGDETQSAAQVDDESIDPTEEFERTDPSHDSVSSSAHRPREHKSETARQPR